MKEIKTFARKDVPDHLIEDLAHFVDEALTALAPVIAGYKPQIVANGMQDILISVLCICAGDNPELLNTVITATCRNLEISLPILLNHMEKQE